MRWDAAGEARAGVANRFKCRYAGVVASNTSPLFSPLILAGLRLLIALYTLLTLCISLAFEAEDGFGDRYVILMFNEIPID